MRKILGQRIRELRQEHGLSLRDLGERLGTSANPTSPAFLSDLENGRRFPSDEMLAKLAQALGTTEVDRNPQFGFAFRCVIAAIHTQNLSPDEFADRVEGRIPSGRMD